MLGGGKGAGAGKALHELHALGGELRLFLPAEFLPGIREVGGILGERGELVFDFHAADGTQLGDGAFAVLDVVEESCQLVLGGLLLAQARLRGGDEQGQAVAEAAVHAGIARLEAGGQLCGIPVAQAFGEPHGGTFRMARHEHAAEHQQRRAACHGRHNLHRAARGNAAAGKLTLQRLPQLRAGAAVRALQQVPRVFLPALEILFHAAQLVVVALGEQLGIGGEIREHLQEAAEVLLILRGVALAARFLHLERLAGIRRSSSARARALFGFLRSCSTSTWRAASMSPSAKWRRRACRAGSGRLLLMA